jgi:uncharacterized protein YodC (DUF2158 family)
MKYKSGDVVIKTTGGNKMTIFDKVNDSYKCLWFVESIMNESVFKEEEIVSLEEYKKYLRIEERDDKLSKLLS